LDHLLLDELSDNDNMENGEVQEQQRLADTSNDMDTKPSKKYFSLPQ
jgi:hypothetical protein